MSRFTIVATSSARMPGTFRVENCARASVTERVWNGGKDALRVSKPWICGSSGMAFLLKGFCRSMRGPEVVAKCLSSQTQTAPEIRDRLRQPLGEHHTWRPAEYPFRQANIRATLNGVILRQRIVDDARGRPRQRQDRFGQCSNRDLV